MIKATILNHSVKGVFSIFIMLVLMSSSVRAQKTYTTIKKNVNFTASNFTHQLSASQDALILEGDVPFNKVRFLSDEYKKSFEFSDGVHKSEISLKELPLGKYTVLFYDVKKIIVFRLARLLPFEKKQDKTVVYSVASSASASYSKVNYSVSNNTQESKRNFNFDKKK
jgi:hypothetical protein